MIDALAGRMRERGVQAIEVTTGSNDWACIGTRSNSQYRQERPGRDDTHAFITLQDEQIIIACDNVAGLSCQRSFDVDVVVRIAAYFDPSRGLLIDLYPPDLDENEQEDALEAPLSVTRTRREPGQSKQRPIGKHREVSKKEKKKSHRQALDL